MPPIPVTVIGARPVGLLTTLHLARAGIPVTCLDSLPAIDASPRAMAYHPTAVRELDRAGVLHDCQWPGSTGRGICWRRTRDKEIIALIERTPTAEFAYENLVIGQHELAAVNLRHLERLACAEVRFGTKVLGVEQRVGGDEVTLTVEGEGDETSKTTSSYAVAADGEMSTMRRLLGIGSNDGLWRVSYGERETI